MTGIFRSTPYYRIQQPFPVVYTNSSLFQIPRCPIVNQNTENPEAISLFQQYFYTLLFLFSNYIICSVIHRSDGCNFSNHDDDGSSTFGCNSHLFLQFSLLAHFRYLFIPAYACIYISILTFFFLILFYAVQFAVPVCVSLYLCVCVCVCVNGDWEIVIN